MTTPETPETPETPDTPETPETPETTGTTPAGGEIDLDLRDIVVAGPDGRARCSWAVGDDLLAEYHDHEWGCPVLDEAGLFERICLEAFQAGLSWRTVLSRRPALRRAFHDFDVDRVASMTDDELEELLADAGIIRNRAKVRAARDNARATVALRSGEGLVEFIWSYAPDRHARPALRSDAVAVTAESAALARALKARGFRFVGPTSTYALMQAAGVVNDHGVGCFRGDELEVLARADPEANRG